MQFQTPISTEHLPGSYTSLFECDYDENTPWLDKVFWGEACRRRPSRWMPAAMRERCLHGKMLASDRRLIVKRCLQSQLRVVKTVRFRNYVRDLPVDDPNLRVIHLVRQPNLIAASWFRKGWRKYNPDRIGKALCYAMTDKLTAFNSLRPDQFLRVYSGDILRDPLEWAKRLFAFIGIDFSQDTYRWVQQVIKYSNNQHARRQEEASSTESQAHIQVCGGEGEVFRSSSHSLLFLAY